MELLCDVGHVESHFRPFGDSVSVGCQIGSWFVPNVPLAQKSFWTHPMVLLGDEAQVKLDSVWFEIVLILMQDSCTVSAKCIRGSEFIMDAPDGTPT